MASSSKAYWTQRSTARGDSTRRKLSPESQRQEDIENSLHEAHKQVLESLAFLAKEIDLKIALSNGKITNAKLGKIVIAALSV